MTIKLSRRTLIMGISTSMLAGCQHTRLKTPAIGRLSSLHQRSSLKKLEVTLPARYKKGRYNFKGEKRTLDLRSRECMTIFSQLIRDTREDEVREANPELLDLLVLGLQDHCGESIELSFNSGFRTLKTNTEVGGANDSYHMKAQALDFSVNGISTQKIHNGVKNQVNWGGIIRYPNKGFNHFDIRQKPWRDINYSA